MRNSALLTLSFGLLSLLQGNVTAATWVGGTGDWSVSGNWSGGTPTGFAAINSGNAHVTTTALSNQVEVDYGGALTVNNGRLYSNGTTEDYYVSAGLNGVGTLTVENGGAIDTWQVDFGYFSGGVGSGTVTGTGSSIEAGGHLLVGFEGVGHLLVEDGGSVVANGSSGIFAVGYTDTQTESTLTVSGEGSSVTANYQLQIGHYGRGRLLVEDGGTVNALQMHIAVQSNTVPSTVLITGEGSSLTLVNGVNIGEGGKGELTVEDGATMDGGGGIYISAFTGSAGKMNIRTGGDVSADFLSVGGAASGILNVTEGGKLTIRDGMDVSYSGGQGVNSEVVVDGEDSVIDVANALRIGNGNFKVSNSGSVIVNGTEDSFLGVGDGDGESSLLVETGGTIEASGLYIGNTWEEVPSLAQGTVTVQGLGSTMDLGKLLVGYRADGFLKVLDGGEVNVTGDVQIGIEDTYGNVYLQGAGSQLSFDGTVTAGGVGSFISVMDGATLSGPTVMLGNGTQLNIGQSVYEMPIGLLAVDEVTTDAPTSAAQLNIIQSAGSLTYLTQDGTDTGDTIEITSGVALNLSGGITIIGTGNSYTGGTTVDSNGTLVIQNSHDTSATGSGLVSVKEGSGLEGMGRIGGSVEMRGYLKPYNPVDGASLTIAGDLHFYDTSTLVTAVGTDTVYSLTVGGEVVIDAFASLNLINPAPLTENSYTLLDAYNGIITDEGFVLNGTLPEGYDLVYSENRLELVRKVAQFGEVTASTDDSAIIVGGSTHVTVTVENTAPTGASPLDGTVTGGSGNISGGGTVSVNPGETGTAVDNPDDPLTFTGSVVGTESGMVTVIDPNADGSPGVASFDVTVYGHAIAEVSDTTLNLGYLHEGYAGAVTSNSVDVTNGEATDFIVDLKGSGATSGDISLNGFNSLTAGETTQITATLQEGHGVGVINETIAYTFGDDSTLNGAVDFTPIDFTVTGEVYSGQGVWNRQGGGSWGTLENGFGANWQAGGGTPGLDAAFTTTDTATFGTAGSGVVSLDGATPSLRAITFDNADAEYQLRTGSGGSIALNAGGDVATITNLNGSHLIALPLDLVSNTRVEVANANDRLTIQGPISGDGTLTIAGDGRTILSSNEAYFGDTIVESGSLASRHIANSRLVLNGGVYSPNDLNAIAEVGVDTLVLNGGALEFDLGDNDSDRIVAVNDAILNEATHFDFNDAGFTSSSVYELISSYNGSLIGFNDVSLLSFSSANIDNLQGVFGVQDNTLFFRPWIEGEVITGPVLSNSAPYLIPTLATFGAQGDVVTLGTDPSVTIDALEFAPLSTLSGSNEIVVTSGSVKLANGPALITGGLTLSSAQPLTVSGPGALYVASGNTLTSTGPVTFSSGGVVMNGTVNSPIIVVGPATVFYGSGIALGNFTNSGELHPGNSPGTFTTAGDFTQTSSGSLHIEVGSHDHDRLLVGGVARLDGTLRVSSYNGHQFAYGDEVTFLYASDITGEFDKIISPDASRFRVRFIEDGGEGSILIAPTSYTLLANTPNERSTAKALDRFIDADSGDRQTVSIALDRLREGEYAHAFQQVSPAFYSSMAPLILSQANTQNQTLAQRLDHQRLAGAARGFRSSDIEAPITVDRNGKNVLASDKNPTLLEPTPENRWSVWVEGNGAFTKVPNALQIGDKQYRGGGFLVGSDYQWSDLLTTGLFGGYQGMRADYGGGNKIALDSAIFGAYAAWQAGGLHGNVILSGGAHQFDVRRSIDFGSIDRQARSHPQARQFNAYLDLGRDFNFGGGFTFTPIVAGQYSYANLSSFSEDGADSLNLNVRKQDAHSLRSDLGARVAYTAIVNNDVLIIPEIRATWNHEFLNTDRALNSTFSGAPGQAMSFQTTGQERDSLNLGAGVSAHINQSWNVSLFYNANLARESSDTSHAVTGSIGWKF